MGHLRTSAALVLVLAAPACLLGRDLTMAEPTASENAIVPTPDGGSAGEGGDGSAKAPSDAPGTDEDGADTTSDAGADAMETPIKVDGGDAGTGPAAPRCPEGKNDETEPNGLPLVGDTLASGTFCGSIYRALDIDVLKLDLGAQGALKIQFDATGDARIVLKGPTQTIEGASGFKQAFVSSGAWTITIQSPGGNLQNWVIVRD